MFLIFKNENRIMNLYKEDSDKLNDDDALMNLVPRLPVATFDSYDPSIPPENGADYLRRVQLESQQEPSIKVAEQILIRKPKCYDYHVKSIEEKEFIRSLPAFEIHEQSIVPSLIESFLTLRQHIDDLRTKCSDTRKLIQHTRKWWREYCFSHENKSNHMGYKPENSYHTNLPRLSLLARISQKEVCRLLYYHYEWLREDGHEKFTIERGLWLYSLLAALDSIQPDDTYCLLRQITRLCSRMRNEFQIYLYDNISGKDGDDVRITVTVGHIANDNQCSVVFQKLASLNLIILLVGYYFNQKDLLDSWK
nr:gem-associated protein 2-like [Dermatophagoides farinae]